MGGVRVTLLPTAHSRADAAPSPREAGMFLDLAEQVLERFRPDVLLTYGGHPACLELMRRLARAIAVVFHLHNFGYNDRRGFADVSAVHLSVRVFAAAHYRRLGLDGTVIADPDAARSGRRRGSRAAIRHIRQPAAGERGDRVGADCAGAGPAAAGDPVLGRRGPGRRPTGWRRLPVDLSGLTNLNRMANTPDPATSTG